MIAESLLGWRNLRGLSQEEIAYAIGISRQAYGKWENGTVTPDIQKCLALADLYKISLDMLVSGPGGEPTPAVPQTPAGKYIFGTLSLSDKGQIVIPKRAREVFGLKPGSRLVLLGDEMEGLALVREEDFMNRMKKAMELAAIEK